MYSKNMGLIMFFVYAFTVLNYHVVNSKLELVHVFFRHGSRAPSKYEMYPNNPNINFWKKIGFGELTSLGKQQSVQLGKQLRSRYQSFLSKEYDPEEVFTKSTDFNRTRETASLVLDGIFLVTNISKGQYDIQWTTRSKDYDLMFPVNYCAGYVKELERLKNSSQFQEHELKYKNVFETISANTGKSYKSIIESFFLFQVLYSERYINLTTPDWATNLYETLKEITTYEFYTEISTPKLNRLNGGKVLKKIIEDMRKKISNTIIPQNRKIFLHSGHDLNILGIQGTMNVFTPHFPNFNSATIVELHSNTNLKKYYVKVFYIKHVDEEATELFIKECGNPCELSKFEEIMHPYLPLNYTQECESEVLLE